MQNEKKSILSSASLVGALTLVSRLLGVARDAAIARALGDSRVNDIFNMAFEIPNLARRVLGEGALSAFIVPIFHQREKEGGSALAFRFFNEALSAMTLIGGALTVAGMLAARPLFIAFGGLKFFIDGDPESLAWLALGEQLTRIMFPFLLALTLVSLFMGICHAHQRFLTPALGSSALNLSIIATALLASSTEKPHFAVCLAWAVMLGVTARLALMVPTLWRVGWRLRWRLSLASPGMKSLFAKMGAATFGAGLAQLNISINLILANWTGEGSVTYLRYGHRLIEFPLALLASALATPLVPLISRHYLNKDFAEARSLGRFTVRVLLTLILPAMVAFWAVGQPILALIFQRGEWSAEATANTAFALSMYAAGLIPLAILRLLIPLYYAKGDVKTPVKVAAGALVVNIVANLILIQTPLSYAGLALGSSIAATFNAWMLWSLLRRDIGSLWDNSIAETLLKCSLAAAGMGMACRFAWRAWETQWPVETFLPRLAQVLVLCAFGAFIYFILAWMLKLTGLREAMNLVKRRGKPLSRS